MTEGEYLKELGKNVRLARQSLRMSIREVSEILDFDEKTVARIERGERNSKIITLNKISEALRIDIRHLLP